MNRYSFSKIRKSSRRSFDASCELQVADMSVLVTRKSMKSIRLKVTPLGEVRVSAPYNVSDDEIRHMVESRLEWIYSQQQAFANSPQSEAERATK